MMTKYTYNGTKALEFFDLHGGTLQYYSKTARMRLTITRTEAQKIVDSGFGHLVLLDA